MCKLSQAFVDKVTKSCLDAYEKLPKTGKPTPEEWTVLSCVVQYEKENGNIEVVSLGTGSKCIGAAAMSPSGDIMNDSHAEVFARRGFLLYLYDNIEKCIESKLSIVAKSDDGKFILKNGIEFVFYSSQLPCGDASIIHKDCDNNNFGNVLQPLKREAEYDICDTATKKLKFDYVQDIHRTGAKCLPHADQDTYEPGVNYHLLGQVRTKPGRGDRTLSVSCSDKMSRWIYLGVQGALLDLLFTKPIYIKYFIFGADVPYSEESLNRALLYRNNYLQTEVDVPPKFYNSSVVFSCIKKGINVRSSPNSIVWTKTGHRSQVAVLGKRLGVTKKKSSNVKNAMCISKYHLYVTFQRVLMKCDNLKERLIGDADIYGIPYSEMKKKAECYYKKWKYFKDTVFKMWTLKPDMWNFCIEPSI